MSMVVFERRGQPAGSRSASWDAKELFDADMRQQGA
jgi:hypothetical protein